MANTKTAAATKSTAAAVNVPGPIMAAWRAAFGDAVGVPAFIVHMAVLVAAAWHAVPADKRAAATFDTWLAAIRSADKIPAPVGPVHRFTNGSGRDISRTQNALYVACALSGIAARDITNAFGMALWTHIENGTNTCKYRNVKYWLSTMGAFVNGRHLDTYTVPNDAARRAVDAWRTAKPAAEPAADAPKS